MYDRVYQYPTGHFIGGKRRQRGGGFFGRVARMALPFLRRVGRHIVSNVGELATDSLGNLIEGRDVNFANQGYETLRKTGSDILNDLSTPSTSQSTLYSAGSKRTLNSNNNSTTSLDRPPPNKKSKSFTKKFNKRKRKKQGYLQIK